MTDQTGHPTCDATIEDEHDGTRRCQLADGHARRHYATLDDGRSFMEWTDQAEFARPAGSSLPRPTGDLTPAQELRTAAQALEDAANATTYEMRHGTYWQGLPTGEAWQRGITNAVGDRAGDFCALMSPDVAKGFATVLRQAADALEGADVADDEPCLAVARAILTGGAQ